MNLNSIPVPENNPEQDINGKIQNDENDKVSSAYIAKESKLFVDSCFSQFSKKDNNLIDFEEVQEDSNREKNSEENKTKRNNEEEKENEDEDEDEKNKKNEEQEEQEEEEKESINNEKSLRENDVSNSNSSSTDKMKTVNFKSKPPVKEINFKMPAKKPKVDFNDKQLDSICDKFVEGIFKEYVIFKNKKNINATTITENEAQVLDYYLKFKPEIIKIQKNWKTHYDIQKIEVLKEKSFYIQRSFRNYLIKKYNLPQNFYYNDKFMKIQNTIFEDNYKDNLNVLFPALFLDKSDLNYFASNMVAMSNNPTHNPYEPGKINLFGKILDFDMMIETDECYETLWASIYDSIYTKCLKLNAPLQLLAVGGQHTLCVNNKGKIFTFGWNNYGQCGVPISSTVISKNDLNNNYLVEVTKNNELKPKIVNRVDGVKIPEIDQVIMSNAIACGEDHSLILDQEGGVWAFGLNLNGQLGLGHTNIVEKPTKVTALNKHFITSVKSEGNINFAVSSKGDAFMWPWSDKGNIQYIPRKFSLKTANEKVNSIACGNNFVLVLSSAGMVYSMGRTNKFGQLGHGDYEPRLHLSLIQYFVSNSERITQISCGFKHCVAKSAVNRAYTWGMGCKGQLGHNNYSNLTIPAMVKMENFTKVYQVSAGFRCTFFLCDNRKIYACGCNGTISMEKVPIPFDIIDKIPEMSLEQSYSVVRIMNTWNKSFSVFYATVADCSSLKMSPVKLSNILNQLAYKWDYEGINAPYIESIAGYFPISFMKKTKTPN